MQPTYSSQAFLMIELPGRYNGFLGPCPQISQITILGGLSLYLQANLSLRYRINDFSEF